MKFGAFAARFALVLTCVLATVAPAQAKFWQCATYAREISAVKIHGNAWTWWGQAAGKYERGNAPKIGAIMSFQRTGKNPFGHVAMVSGIVGDREVLLTHANWSRRGGVERDVRAIDVSPAGDWSQVKVWFAPVGGLGGSVYPVNGFIYPDAAPALEPVPTETYASPLLMASAKVPSLDLDLSDLKLETGVN